jgi:glycosyltransferase involved in cell wall biosynthesis
VRILVLESVPNFGGGSEAVALEICKELSKRGHEIFLAYEVEGTMLPVYGKYARKLWQSRLPCFGWRTLVQSFDCVRKLGQFIKSNQIDVVFSTHLGYLRTLALVKFFYQVETVYHLGLPRDTADWSLKWAIGKIFAGIAPSQRTAESWQKCGWPKEKLFVVPNWIDILRFKVPDNKADVRRQVGLLEAAPLIVYVGRITPEKGVETLIHAFYQVLKTFPKTKLVLVGRVDEQYYINLKSIYKKLSIPENKVIKIGICKSIENYFAAADVVVVPSIWDEPFGLVLIEAMACGTLTLVSSSGELPNIIGSENEDLIFPAGDVDTLANHLIYWLSQPEQSRKRGHQLHERAVKNFNQSDKVDIYEKVMLAACLDTSQDLRNSKI